MLEPCREPDLAQKPLGAEQQRDLRAQHLDRDGTVVLQVLGEIDECRPATAQLVSDRIATVQRGAEWGRCNLSHSSTLRS